MTLRSAWKAAIISFRAVMMLPVLFWILGFVFRTKPGLIWRPWVTTPHGYHLCLYNSLRFLEPFFLSFYLLAFLTLSLGTCFFLFTTFISSFIHIYLFILFFSFREIKECTLPNLKYNKTYLVIVEQTFVIIIKNWSKTETQICWFGSEHFSL